MNINIHNVVSVKKSCCDFPANGNHRPFSKVEFTVMDDEGAVYELKLFSDQPITIEDGGEE